MSGLETLPPDQRAVLKLILEQGRGYEELASLLKVDPAAVRTRAHAGLDALGVAGAGELTPERRAQVADYLLGQQDEGQRIVALAELGDSPEAIRWGHALRERLTPLARDPLPELPAVANGNGAAPAPTPAAVAQPTPPPPPEPPTVVQPAPAAPEPTRPPSSTPRPSSRLGGAILLAAIAAAVVVGAILLLTGGDDKSPATSTPPVAQTQPQTTSTTQSTTGTPTTAGTAIGQVNLNATSAGGQAVGVGLVLRQKSGKLSLAIQAEKLPANGAQDIYAAWLQGSSGPKLLGFVPRRVKQNGTFTASAPIHGAINNGDTVLITHESTANPTQVPTTPGEAILSGPVQLQR